MPNGTGHFALAFGPADERFGIEAGAEFFAHDSEIALEVEIVAEFGDELLALKNCGARGWRFQPSCELVFAHGEASGGEEFEEAAAAEEVEVVGVDVIGVAEALASLAGACPAVLDAGDAAAVHGGGGFCAGAGANDALVNPTQNQVSGDGEPELFGAEGFASQREVGEDEADGDDR